MEDIEVRGDDDGSVSVRLMPLVFPVFGGADAAAAEEDGNNRRKIRAVV